MSTAPDTEAVLVDRFNRQAGLYAEVSEMIDQLRDGLRTEGDTTALLEQITERLREAADLTPDSTRIDSSSLTSGDRSAVLRVREVLQQLVTQIQETETLATAARDRLLPQVNDETRRKQMLNAYASQPSTSRTG